eukprot:3540858-Rhodomonas_salina.1
MNRITGVQGIPISPSVMPCNGTRTHCTARCDGTAKLVMPLSNKATPRVDRDSERPVTQAGRLGPGLGGLSSEWHHTCTRAACAWPGSRVPRQL